jgi:hypothetical protein
MGSPSPPQSITCIYCKKDRTPSREHVLQRGLGGDLVAPILCGPCNNGFSGIDRALAERSLVAMDRVAFTPEDGFEAKLGGDHFHFDTDVSIWCDIAVTNGFRPILFPQVHLMPGAENLGVLASDLAGLERLRDFVSRKLESGTLRKMHLKVGPERNCNTAHLTMHRDNDGFVRVPTPGAENALFDVLETGWKAAIDQNLNAARRGEVMQTNVEHPSISLSLKVRFDEVFRAVAKSAFNLVAEKLGAPFALRTEFDPLRAYIRGIELVHGETAPGQVRVDGRFVTWSKGQSLPIVPTSEHAITLAYLRPTFYAWVTLYSSHNFVVRLADIDAPLDLPTTHEFSIVRRGNQALSVEEVYRRLSERKSE